MNKQKMALLVISAVIVSITITFLFLPKTPAQNTELLLCDPATTDCSKVTSHGIPYVPLSKKESSATNIQSGKIDEHLTIDNTLRDVNFCGTTYKAKQVFINGVDVVQRIAELATTGLKYGEYICRTAYGLRSNGWLASNEIGILAIVNKLDLGTKVYRINLIASFYSPDNPPESASHIGDFEVNPDSGIISIILSGYDAISKDQFGKLK